MKIGFIWKNRPDYVMRIPKDLDHVIIGAKPDGSYSAEDLAKVADVDGLVIAHEPITDELLSACKALKIVQRMGVGYDTINLPACAKRGVYACNLADVNKEALGEHGMLLLLAVARRLIDGHAHTAQADWGAARAVLDFSYELKGKTLGIVGLGNSGFELARRAKVFGMDIIYNNRNPAPKERTAPVDAQFRSLEDLLRESDFISVQTSLNDSTRGLIGAKEIGLMKQGAYIICLARGGIIEEQALADALNAGKLAGAGMDVFSVEPIKADNPLLKAKNVVFTPHAAGTTKECTDREVAWSIANIQHLVVDGQEPQWILGRP